MEIGGYNDVPDWPKMGPSLLIATALPFPDWATQSSITNVISGAICS
jgi:hypothetical protein